MMDAVIWQHYQGLQQRGNLGKLSKQTNKTNTYKHTCQGQEDEFSVRCFFPSLTRKRLTHVGCKTSHWRFGPTATWTDIKMTHLTLTGRDPFQLTFSSTDFHKSKAKSATVAQTHPRFLAHLFSLKYTLFRQDGYTNEKWESVTRFICLFPLTNGSHDVYHVTMVALRSSYSLRCIFHFFPPI